MNLQQAELYQRIQAFSLDNSHDSLSFSKRLARENDWTLEYTHRVIQEYKKLAFLAVVAGHPVSPSEQVDQAWHLHLTYTRSYWEEFCPKVLGIPLHHEPTRGGKAEQAKFDDWYNQTLKSYAEWFGESPPADIWPPAHLRFAQAAELIQADPQQYWVLPKLRFPKPAIALLVLVLALVVVGCTPVMGLGLENPLNFRGPEFLGFYVMLGVPMVGFAGLLRWLLRYPNQGAVISSDLSLYEIAFLAAGRGRAVDTAIANLLQSEHLSLEPETRKLIIANPVPDNCHSLELQLAQAVKHDGNIDRVRHEAIAATQAIRERLQDLGLLVSEHQTRLVKRLPALLVFALLPLGVSKISVGLARHKPVGFLVFLCLIIAIVGGWLFFHSVHRSHY
ncbi:MAG TPA: TIGR04222 domain-containing membrane protein, partial [Allocoleopsis sp.]